MGYMQTSCEQGASVALATTEQRAALRDAAEPMYERMRTDADLGETFRRIEDLVGSAGEVADPEIPDGCQYEPGEEEERPTGPDPLTGPGASGDFPEGVYRTTLSAEFLAEQGVPAEDIRNNAGVFTWTVSDGSWSYEQVPADPSVTRTSCEGFYDVNGDRMTFTTVTDVHRGECWPLVMVAVFEVTDDGVQWTDALFDGESVPEFLSLMNGDDGWTAID
jgi:hypothetical protein